MNKRHCYKLELEYDGTDFAGWQVQPNIRTVQGELEQALSTLFQEKIRVTASGRTDAGVHALGQVVNISADSFRNIQQIKEGLNSLLPNDISVRSANEISEDFNARFDAVRRHYTYQLVLGESALRNRYAWCLPDKLNVYDMQRCTGLLFGEHDFQSFCSSQAEVNHYRCVIEEATLVYQAVDMLVFRIIANRFLHNMVRILVGSMVEVGRGRFSVSDFQQMLLKQNRVHAGVTAPACGLYLVQVDY